MTLGDNIVKTTLIGLVGTALLTYSLLSYGYREWNPFEWDEARQEDIENIRKYFDSLDEAPDTLYRRDTEFKVTERSA